VKIHGLGVISASGLPEPPGYYLRWTRGLADHFGFEHDLEIAPRPIGRRIAQRRFQQAGGTGDRRGRLVALRDQVAGEFLTNT
jgi:hypothetical protein